LKLYFIEIVCIIQNEEQQLQRSALSDDEGKEGPKGRTNPETYSDSEAYHRAAYRDHSTVLRLIIKWSIIYYILYIFYYSFLNFLTHF